MEEKINNKREDPRQLLLRRTKEDAEESVDFVTNFIESLDEYNVPPPTSFASDENTDELVATLTWHTVLETFQVRVNPAKKLVFLPMGNVKACPFTDAREAAELLSVRLRHSTLTPEPVPEWAHKLCEDMRDDAVMVKAFTEQLEKALAKLDCEPPEVMPMDQAVMLKWPLRAQMTIFPRQWRIYVRKPYEKKEEEEEDEDGDGEDLGHKYIDVDQAVEEIAKLLRQSPGLKRKAE